MSNDLYIKDTKEQYPNDIKNMKDEIIMIKETIGLMQNQITEFNEQIQSSTKLNISESVGLVVSLLDKPELSDIPNRVENKTEGLNQCDIWEFESENKKLMTSHIIENHDDCYCCYLCNNYFETKRSLKYHTEFIYKEYCNMTDSEGEENPQINSNDSKQKHKQKKHRKTKKGVNK